MKRSEQAALDCYVDNRDAQLIGKKYDYPYEFFRDSNERHIDYLKQNEGMIDFLEKTPRTALLSDSEEIRRRQEERRLSNQETPRPCDAVKDG